MGAYGPSVGDVRGFLANPAGAAGIRDWDAEVVSSIPQGAGGFVFDGVTIGKRFFDWHALALQYTPGSELDFVIPGSLQLSGLTFAADREIRYTEPFAVAYALRLSPEFSIGVAAWLRSTTVSDPQLSVVDTAIVSTPHDVSHTSWFADIGLRWQPSSDLSLSLVGRALPIAKGTSLPAEFSGYERPMNSAVEAGIRFNPLETLGFSLSAGTQPTGSLGMEWHPWPQVALRASLYADGDQSPFLFGQGAGVGWAVGPVELEMSYLHFTNHLQRKGITASSTFSGNAIRDIVTSPFSPDRLSMGVKLSLGSVRDRLIAIEGTEILSAVYPSSSQVHAYRPIGRVHVKNIGSTSVTAKASMFVDTYMDGPTESAPVAIAPGEETDLPLLAVFNERVQRQTSSAVKDATIAVTSSGGAVEEDKSQARVVIRGKNDWDGNVGNLRFFVRTESQEVLRTTRDILLRERDSLAGGPAALDMFRKARILLSAFSGKLVYVNDPRLSPDYVQYPDETLQLRGGDCDDMTVCFASLLGSIGIASAFVDVVPPGRPNDAHIYLMFDTGLAPNDASFIAENPKRYVLRHTRSGGETVWIPIESTAIMKGFEEAWRIGAKEYYEDAELSLGLARGWVRVMDLE